MSALEENILKRWKVRNEAIANKNYTVEALVTAHDDVRLLLEQCRKYANMSNEVKLARPPTHTPAPPPQEVTTMEPPDVATWTMKYPGFNK